MELSNTDMMDVLHEFKEISKEHVMIYVGSHEDAPVLTLSIKYKDENDDEGELGVSSTINNEVPILEFMIPGLMHLLALYKTKHGLDKIKCAVCQEHKPHDKGGKTNTMHLWLCDTCLPKYKE